MKKKSCSAKAEDVRQTFGPGMLEHVLSKIPKKKVDLLIGFDHADDAAVYRLQR